MTPLQAEPPRPWFIAIGASGGIGLSDITALLAALPANFGGVVLIVLHRPWDGVSRLREILARSCRLPVLIAASGEHFEPGTVYIGEPSDHLTLAARSFGLLVADPARLHRNRTIDLLFRSVARNGGHRMIGVVLSGALDDGARGLAAIGEAGGVTMVLTPDRTMTPGMPEHAIDFDGPIDFVGSSAEIAGEICRLVGAPS